MKEKEGRIRKKGNPKGQNKKNNVKHQIRLAWLGLNPDQTKIGILIKNVNLKLQVLLIKSF